MYNKTSSLFYLCLLHIHQYTNKVVLFLYACSVLKSKVIHSFITIDQRSLHVVAESFISLLLFMIKTKRKFHRQNSEFSNLHTS